VQQNQCYSLITCLFFCSFVCVHLLDTEFLIESSGVVAWLLYIVLVSIYCRRLIALSILNGSFAR
jgi:uncharacterized membrane protein